MHTPHRPILYISSTRIHFHPFAIPRQSCEAHIHTQIESPDIHWQPLSYWVSSENESAHSTYCRQHIFLCIRMLVTFVVIEIFVYYSKPFSPRRFIYTYIIMSLNWLGLAYNLKATQRYFDSVCRMTISLDWSIYIDVRQSKCFSWGWFRMLIVSIIISEITFLFRICSMNIFWCCCDCVLVFSYNTYTM